MTEINWLLKRQDISAELNLKPFIEGYETSTIDKASISSAIVTDTLDKLEIEVSNVECLPLALRLEACLESRLNWAFGVKTVQNSVRQNMFSESENSDEILEIIERLKQLNKNAELGESSQFEALEKLVLELPNKLVDRSFMPIIKFILDEFNLNVGFHAKLTGRYFPRIVISSEIGFPQDYVDKYRLTLERVDKKNDRLIRQFKVKPPGSYQEFYCEVMLNNSEYEDPLFDVSFVRGFWKAYTSKRITPFIKHTELYDLSLAIMEFEDVATFGVREGRHTHFVSIFSDQEFSDDKVQLFEKIMTFVWKARQRNLETYGEVAQIQMPKEEFVSKEIDDLREDFANFAARVAELLAVANDSETGHSVLEAHLTTYQDLVARYTETAADRWFIKCPALWDWSSDPTTKRKLEEKKVLLRVTDPDNGRSRVENAKEFIDRALKEAGVADMPYMHELRDINPQLARAIEQLAARRNSHVGDLVPVAPDKLQPISPEKLKEARRIVSAHHYRNKKLNSD